MSYTVKNTAGNTLVVVPDRSIDRDTTSLALIGFNTTNYGLDHAQNFVHLMEHFANDVSPDNPIAGQLWFDTNEKVFKGYQDGKWSPISGVPSTGGDATEGGIAGIWHCPIDADNTSVALIFAGGELVAVVASKDIVQAHLPASVTINSIEYVFQARFPFGLQGGVNLADDDGTDDYVFSGRVPVADQSRFSGGGANVSEVSGWGYIDIGAGKSVGLMISNGQVVAAISSGAILNSDLPASVSFTLSNSSTDYIFTCSVQSVFPGQVYKQWTVDSSGNPTFDPSQNINNVGLFPGMTFASGINVGGSIGQTVYALVASATSQYGSGIASAIEQVETWVDAHSATAMKVTDLEATFMSATGTTSLASAIQTLIATASDTSSTTTAITDLKSQFDTALGTSTFAEALSKLSSNATATNANTQSLTDIKSSFTNTFGGTTIAEAISNLYASVDNAGNSISGWGLSLDSNGYVTGVEALNGGSSYNYFKVITSNFIISDNNIDFVPFQVVDGIVKMKNVEIDTLKVNTAMIPGRVSATNYIYGAYTSRTGVATPRTVALSYTLPTVTVPGWIEVSVKIEQGAVSDGPWSASVAFDGVEDSTSVVGGGNEQDNVVTQAYCYISQTNYNPVVTLLWAGWTDLSLRERSMFIKFYPYTQ